MTLTSPCGPGFSAVVSRMAALTAHSVEGVGWHLAVKVPRLMLALISARCKFQHDGPLSKKAVSRVHELSSCSGLVPLSWQTTAAREGLSVQAEAIPQVTWANQMASVEDEDKVYL